MFKNLLLLIALLISAQSFSKVDFHPVINYTNKELEVLEVSKELANELLSSSCFEKFVNGRPKLIETNGLTRSQVLKDLSTTELTIPLEMYYKNNGVVGYRQPPYPKVYTNRKFHQGASACSRASNLTHEWSHSLGYGHSYRANYDRQFSVPYTINAGFEYCCRCNGIKDCKILDEPLGPKYKIVCSRKWYFLWLRKTCYKSYI